MLYVFLSIALWKTLTGRVERFCGVDVGWRVEGGGWKSGGWRVEGGSGGHHSVPNGVVLAENR